MFKSVEELKSFITWAKDHKIKRIKLKGVEVEISDIAFIDGLTSNFNTSQTDNSKKPEQNQEDMVDINNDPDLFNSV